MDQNESAGLPPPHGGTLVSLIPDPDQIRARQELAVTLPSVELDQRLLCDLELLLSGGFSPLRGFLGRADCERVMREQRLADGTLWPIPITFDLPAARGRELATAKQLALRDVEGTLLALLEIEEVWAPDRELEAELVYGTRNPRHPGVAALLREPDRLRIGGAVRGVALPVHHDFTALRQTPAALRAAFAAAGWDRIVAFQTRNPLHRAHFELTVRAAAKAQARLLLHPVVGPTRPDDVDHFTRVRSYLRVMRRYPPGLARLSLLPLAMRMAGPREALLHAIVRKNHGCTHLIVGRDHAGPGADEHGRPFYEPFAAQQAVRQHEAELGIRLVTFPEMVYVPEVARYLPSDEVPAGAMTRSLSGTELRRRLDAGDALPDWFTWPEVADELRHTHPPRAQRGVTIFFTGLSGAGKSTIANALRIKLLERGKRHVTLLDGDHVRKLLSSELGFTREHRDLNILRIGYVAAEIARHGGFAICAPIAPFDRARREVRAMVEPVGRFLLVHVATPIEVCEARDRKGLYARARAGLIPQFTGVSDPYETPADADLTLDGATLSPGAAAELVLERLTADGYLPGLAGAEAKAC